MSLVATVAVMYGLFGKVLRKQRRHKELSQEYVATLMGIGPTMVSLIESGQRQPAEEPSEELADALGTDHCLLLAAYRLSRPLQISLASEDRHGRRFWYHHVGRVEGLPITLAEFDELMVEHVDSTHMKGERKR